MKILLVNNHTDYLHNVVNALQGHEIEIQEYRPGMDFHDQGKDLVILSGGGGEGYEMKDKRGGKFWYEDEMEFVLGCDRPLMGICMGFEVVSAAFDSEVRPLGGLVSDFQHQQITGVGRKHFSSPQIKQYEHHRYGVASVSRRNFEVLAESETGIEMIKHRRRPILATQFHPEVKGGTLSLSGLITGFLTV